MSSNAAENASEGEQPSRLVGGVNFPTWSDLKWARAKSHMFTLKTRFDEWQASAPVSVESVLREDSQGMDFILRIPHGLPKHDWALTLGDAVHNFRSAFDAVAWGMAHLNGAAPTNPRRVSFPICETEHQWNEAVRAWLGELPSELRERVRLMQPFAVAMDATSPLSMLHELDVQDKHRETLNVAVDLHALDVGIAFSYKQPNVMHEPRLEMVENSEFGDGVVIGTLYAGAPIEMSGQAILRPTSKLKTSYRGASYDVFEAFDRIIIETRRCLDILMTGFILDEDPDKEK